MKSQTPSTKLQTNLKFQYSMTKTGLEFEISVIVICLLFVICDLEFSVTLLLQLFNMSSMLINDSKDRGLALLLRMTSR